MIKLTSDDTNKGVLVYTPKHRVHHASVTSRENPERLEDGYKYIKNRTKIFEHLDLNSEFDPLTKDNLRMVHEEKYIEFIERYCKKGGGFLGDSTYLQKGSYKIARYSAGGGIEVCRNVIDDYDMGFALIRPPGHHALPDSYGGYCLFNNAALAARWLQKDIDRKVMIIDWDGHAANGTMRIFYEDPSVLTISIHRDPEGFYPHDGFTHQIGRGDGRGYHVNICMPEGAGDQEFRRACKEIIFPLAEEFDPDFVIGCNGFDSHHSDSVVGLRYTTSTYYYIASELSSRFNERLAVLMEGGYEKFNGKLLHTLLSGLIGLDNPHEDTAKNLSGSILQKGSICKETNDMLEELKSTISDFPLGSSFDDN